MIVFKLGFALAGVSEALRFVAANLNAVEDTQTWVDSFGQLWSRPLNSEKEYVAESAWVTPTDIWLMSNQVQLFLHVENNCVKGVTVMAGLPEIASYHNYLKQLKEKGVSYDLFVKLRRKTLQKGLRRFQRRGMLLRAGLTTKQVAEFLNADLQQSTVSRIPFTQLTNV